MVEKLDIHLNNMFLKCGYPQGQVDGWKVQVLFNAFKYFDIKWYMCEHSLTMVYETMLNKCKSIKIPGLLLQGTGRMAINNSWAPH